MIALREATAADIPAIGALWNPLIRDTAITFRPDELSDAEIAAYIGDRQRAGHPFLLAMRDGALLGYACYGQFRGGPGYARSMEHSINIAPEAHGAGIGRMLMAAIENHARARGHRLMIGGISGTNTGSLRFHARLGYVEWGRIPAAGWKFGRFHDLVFMGKDLGA